MSDQKDPEFACRERAAVSTESTDATETPKAPKKKSTK